MRLKFKLDRVTQTLTSTGHKVAHLDLTPVRATDVIGMRAVPENDALWGCRTHDGRVSLSYVKPEVAAQLVVGGEYYVEITPVPVVDDEPV
jgi:hypothetical protein